MKSSWSTYIHMYMYNVLSIYIRIMPCNLTIMETVMYVDLLCCSNDASGYLVTMNYTSKYVHKHSIHLTHTNHTVKVTQHEFDT